MFKIQENADGSTSVYHKKTGQHMCTIPVKPNSSSPLRINVVEPQRSCSATVVVKDWRLSNFKTKVPDDSSTEESSDDDLKSSSSRVSSPEPLRRAIDSKEAFVRALNLLPPGQEERGQWPLRRVSRVEPGWPRLITELTPLSCRLGTQLLHEDPEKLLLQKEVRRLAAVRKYEGLCVAAGLPPSEPHARLRCRDRRTAYPVCTSSKTLRAESIHVYSCGRRQRRERLRVIETGLDKRSRQLLTQCRECEVRLDRLSKEEIRRWRRRRRPTPVLPPSPPVPPQQRHVSVRLPDVTRCIVHNHRDGHYYLAGTCVRVLDYAEFLAARPPLRPRNSEPPLIDLTLDSPPKKSTLQNRDRRRLQPPLQNCTSRQQRSPAQYHVVNNSASRQQRTPIQLHVDSNCTPQQQRPSAAQLHVVGNCASRQQRTPIQLHDDSNCTSRQQRPPAQYHVVGNSVSRQQRPPPQLSHCVSRRRAHHSVSVLRPPRAQTGNSVVSRQVGSGVPAHGPVLRAMLQLERQLPTHFRCFACGCNRYISNNAETEVLEHMRRFHSVMDPDRFLTVYRDQVKRCTIVEAFPGYKGNND